MSIKKQYLKSKDLYKVVWTVEKEKADQAKKINLVGDFNEWNENKAEFTALKNGSFKCVVELPKGRHYQFRYLIDGQVWMNDDEADGFVDNQISDELNSVVAL
ncbi:MAG: isoamylase early set domain-containing protein [Reichenbachiella sp.]|uniref:isoamylase early set domain-containing protein n=1 Tax=Reichenbachiella sp. TaxID=2184521 RepID=UPI0032660CBF